jgi:hypothetical protein
MATHCLLLGKTPAPQWTDGSLSLVQDNYDNQTLSSFVHRGKSLYLHISYGTINSSTQISYKEKICIANVLYYFCLCFGDVWYPLAMVEIFSKPDADIVSESTGTVYLCNPQEGIAVVSIMLVHSVVAMFPDTQVEPSGNITLTGKFSLMQHPYIEVAQFTSDNFFEDEEENID